VVLRGDLAELKGPGGLEATFVRTAKTRVTATGGKVEANEGLTVIAKGSLADLMDRARRIEPNDPVLMTMTLGHQYGVGEVMHYLEILSQFPRFRLIAFLKASGKFRGCTGPSELAALMRNGSLGVSFLAAIAGDSEGEVFRYPGILQKVVPSTATNAEALAAMTDHNLGAIAVVDDQHLLRGIVEREQLVSKLVLSLASASQVSSG